MNREASKFSSYRDSDRSKDAASRHDNTYSSARQDMDNLSPDGKSSFAIIDYRSVNNAIMCS